MEHQFYDKSLKELFSQPELVKDFLQRFVDEEFIKDIDFSRVEKKNTSYVAKTFKNKHADLVLKVNMINGKCAYLYLLFEFQSTVDKLMPMRILSYMLLLYEDLIKQKEIPADEPLPPVFPLVLYTGTETYTAATKIEDLIAVPYKRLQKYVPSFEHYLVTVRSKPRDELKRLTKLDSFVAGFFYFLTAGTEEEIKEAEKLVSGTIDYASDIGRFYVMWLRKYLEHKGIELKTHVKEGGEVMLETVIDNIREEGKREAREEAREEARKEKRAIAVQLLNKEFPVKEIATIVGISEEEVEGLKKTI